MKKLLVLVVGAMSLWCSACLKGPVCVKIENAGPDGFTLLLAEKQSRGFLHPTYVCEDWSKLGVTVSAVRVSRGEGTPKETIWQLQHPESAVVERLVYGVTPPGFKEVTPAQPLASGDKIEVDIKVSGHTDTFVNIVCP